MKSHIYHLYHAICNYVFYLPIEVWFVFIHIDVVEWILSEPSVDSESVLIRPFGNWWQCYSLGEDTHIRAALASVYCNQYAIQYVITSFSAYIYLLWWSKCQLRNADCKQERNEGLFKNLDAQRVN